MEPVVWAPFAYGENKLYNKQQTKEYVDRARSVFKLFKPELVGRSYNHVFKDKNRPFNVLLSVHFNSKNRLVPMMLPLPVHFLVGGHSFNPQLTTTNPPHFLIENSLDVAAQSFSFDQLLNEGGEIIFWTDNSARIVPAGLDSVGSPFSNNIICSVDGGSLVHSFHYMEKAMYTFLPREFYQSNVCRLLTSNPEKMFLFNNNIFFYPIFYSLYLNTEFLLFETLPNVHHKYKLLLCLVHRATYRVITVDMTEILEGEKTARHCDYIVSYFDDEEEKIKRELFVRLLRDYKFEKDWRKMSMKQYSYLQNQIHNRALEIVKEYSYE